MNEMSFLYNGARIHFSSQGEGRPIILLHGFLESSMIWEPFVEKWAEDRQVVAIDLPGHGKSEVIGEVHSMENFAGVLHHLIGELNLFEVDLLGHSMGGYVSLAYLEHYSDKVRNIILMNSMAAADTDERKHSRDRAAALVGKNKSVFVSMAHKNLLAPGNYQIFKTSIESLKNEALEFPIEGVLAALNGMKSRTSKIEVLKAFSGGKFFIVGKYDPVLAIEDVVRQAVEVGAELYELPGGHLSFLENALQVERIVRFID